MKKTRPQAIVFRHKKTKKTPFVSVTFRADKSHIEYLKENGVCISSLMRELIADIVANKVGSK